MSVSFDAVVNDESGVSFVELMYKQETAAEWKSVLMSEVGGGLYQGTIQGNDVYDQNLEFAMFQELASALATMQGSKTCDRVGCLLDNINE